MWGKALSWILRLLRVDNERLLVNSGSENSPRMLSPNKITYFSHRLNSVLHVSCDFRDFQSAPEGGSSEAVPLSVKEIEDLASLRENHQFRNLCESVNIDPDDLTSSNSESWTLCILETLKPKAQDLKIGRLKWVLRTAMPLKTDFAIYVDNEEVKRTEDEFNPIIKFTLDEIEHSRLVSLNEKLDDDWKWSVKNEALVSSRFPSGLSGTVLVTERSLIKGKSADIGRSHGFFVYVRDRLLNQTDELFGLHALSHATFNFFRADISADDLHSEVTAPRESLELGKKRDTVCNVLLALFSEARQRKRTYEEQIDDKEKEKREHVRQFVPVRLVDRPIADTLTLLQGDSTGTDADESSFFFKINNASDMEKIANTLYTQAPRRYRYRYDRLGKTERLAKLDPEKAEFTLNEDHEFILAYSDSPRSRHLLEDIVASEVLLEVYLREAGINPYIIGEVLERRDLLMRSLAQDRVFSLEAIAQLLVDSRDDEHDLEVALVAAVRALGFNAKHMGQSGEPDGVARFNDYKSGETKITLEAKSSRNTPTLATLDFAGLSEHINRNNAQGCLLVAPDYPGEKTNKDDTAVEFRAKSDKVSCWTIDDLSHLVRVAEKLQITATQVLEIVLNKFTPKDVSAAVQNLLQSDDIQNYFRKIITILKNFSKPGILPNTVRTVQHISAMLAQEHDGISDEIVRNALVQISGSSQGMLRLSKNSIIFSGEIEELERRVSNLTGQSGEPRKLGSFRSGDASEDYLPS